MKKSMTEKNILVSEDKSKLDIDFIYNFLSQSYWGKGREREAVLKSISNSLCFGIYDNDRQIGFARVVTDYTYFAYLFDVFIIDPYRGNGYSKKLLRYIFDNDKLSSIKKWMLTTTDAHGLYKKFGFTELSSPEKIMEWVVNKK